jgi:hypothetical protein
MAASTASPRGGSQEHVFVALLGADRTAATLRVRRYGEGMSTLDAYLGNLAYRTSAVLGESLVALYLHGSAAMDAFVPSRSDVDVLCITRGSLSPSQKRGLAQSLSEASLPCPGVGTGDFRRDGGGGP